MMLSDVEDCNREGVCRSCFKESFYWIEIEHEDGYRERGLWCRTHGDDILDMLQKNAEAERAEFEARKARLGFDPTVFCERCGYRECRCYHDPLIDAPPMVLTVGDSYENVG